MYTQFSQFKVAACFLVRLKYFCTNSESEGGRRIKINPHTIRIEAGNFQLKKLTPLTPMSTAAFTGIPSNVPIEINNGKVYAIPKLMLRLNKRPRAELAQMYTHGISDISSTFNRCKASTSGHKNTVLNRPSEERNNDIW